MSTKYVEYWIINHEVLGVNKHLTLLGIKCFIKLYFHSN